MLKKLLLLCLTTVASVSAIDLVERCWEVGGEVLYWRPCDSPFQYGADNGTVGQIDYLDLKPDYDVGFRIFGDTYTWDCCHLFTFDWTHLRTSDSRRHRQDGIIIFPINTPLTGDVTINAQLKYKYDKVSVRPGRYVSCHCNSMFYTYGGARYVNIERKQKATADGDNLAINEQNTSFEGGALEIGAGADIAEPCNFWIVGRVTGLMAIGERRFRHQVTANTNVTDMRHPIDTTCVFGAELRLGVKYRYECSCMWINLEIGYELDHYFNALRLMVPTGIPTSQSPSTQLADAGFGGLYANASVRF